MAGEYEKELEGLREYCMNYYGHRVPSYELMGEYLPGPMLKWIEMRKMIFEEPPIGALTTREKELVALAMELVAHKPKQEKATGAEVHAKLAIEAGASVKQVAEVCMMGILLGGMMTYVVSGHNALQSAKDLAKELGKEK